MSKMLIDRAAVEQALEALETDTVSLNAINNAAALLRTALEQKAEVMIVVGCGGNVTTGSWSQAHQEEPPRRERSCDASPLQTEISLLKELGEKVHRLLRRAQGGK